jgi:hypothetical protein
VIDSGPSGTLSSQIGAEGYDLGGYDCQLSFELSVVAHYNSTGSEFSDRFIQTLYFEDSASCRSALLNLQEQMYEGGAVPSFFFNWFYVNGINLGKLDQIKSMTTAYSIYGSRSSEASVTTDAPPTTVPLAPRRSSKGGFRGLIKESFRQALKPIR